METTPEKKTMRGVVWQKLVRAVDAHSLRELGLFLLLLFLAGTLSLAVVSPERALQLREWRGGAFPMLVQVNLFVFLLPRLYGWVRGGLERATEWGTHVPDVEAGDQLDGIPVMELIDHLFRARTFKRDDVETRWRIPRYRYTALAQKLKALGVLTHGANNATVLAEDMSREDVARILSSAGTAEELELPVRIVRPLPSPAPFSRRKIACETLEETAVQPLGNQCATVCATA